MRCIKNFPNTMTSDSDTAFSFLLHAKTFIDRVTISYTCCTVQLSLIASIIISDNFVCGSSAVIMHQCSVYALRVMWSHDIPCILFSKPAIYNDFLNSLQCSVGHREGHIGQPGLKRWHPCSAADRARLVSFLTRCKRLGFADEDFSSVSELFNDADDAFFHALW